MPKIDTCSWGEFTVSDVCCVLKGRKKLSNINITDLGSTPVYSSTTENNGIIGYTEESPDYVIDTDTPFYIIFGDHTKSMYISTNDFCVMDNVKVLIPKVYNKYAMQFVLASWQKSIPTLGYSRHWSVAEKAIFKLPTDSKGNPDWQYMEEYMRNIEVRVSDSLSKLESAQGVENSKIDVSNWGDFCIGDYFKVEYGKFRPKEMLGNGEFSYITTSGFNNGVTETIDVADHNGNCITVASDGALMGSAFYQENPFSTSNIVSTLTPFTTTPLNKYNAMFLCVLIFSKRSEFGWLGFKFSVDRVRNLKLKLPVDTNGEPDWQYMENYMKALEIKVKGFLDKTA